jgi:DNA-binding MarR family transcriptional regulator
LGDARTRIEQQLTMLLRRAQRVHIMGIHATIDLDRSAYAILCRLDDEGPQRLGALATTFGLDPSTITPARCSPWSEPG